MDVAQKLGRQWIGIDVTDMHRHDRRPDALGLSGDRFRDARRARDLDSAIKLANDGKHQFGQWACWQVGGYRREKKRDDKGVDGWFKHLAEGGKIETGVMSVNGGEILYRFGPDSVG